MRVRFAFLVAVWLCSCVAGPGLPETQPAEESTEFEFYTSDTELITQPVDDIISERCTDHEISSCTNCLKLCEHELKECLFVAKLNDTMIIECGTQSKQCREDCRKSVSVFCNCRKL